jgi:hypothetical protein
MAANYGTGAYGAGTYGTSGWPSSVDLKFTTGTPFDRRWTFTAAPGHWSTALGPLAPHWTFTKAV